MATLSTLVPTNYVLTSGNNSAMTWTNVLTLSSVNASTAAVSSVTGNSISVNSVGYSTLSGSTINASRLNYSSIVGSSVSSNVITLSLTNTSTQNTQIYQVATTNPSTSYTAVQASNVSTGTTYNTLALNPNGGNVGVGTTGPLAPIHVLNATGNPASSPDDGVAPNCHLLLRNTKTGSSPYSLALGVDQTTGVGYINAAGNASLQSVCLNTRGGGVGIGTTTPAALLNIMGTATTSAANTTVLLDNSLAGGVTAAGGMIGSLQFNNAGYAAAEIRVGNDVGSSNNNGNLGFYTRTNYGTYGERMRIDRNGTVYLFSYTTNGTVTTTGSNGQLSVSSDRRIKENIVYQSDTQQGLSSILNLKPATYSLIGSSGTYLGFIAQDLEQEIPLAVDGKKYEWQWEVTEDGKPKFDANGDIVYKLDADGNRIVRPRGVSDRAIIATQTLAIQELAKQLAAKSAALDSLIAWAQTQGYVVGA